jgi:hypothetical protein
VFNRTSAGFMLALAALLALAGCGGSAGQSKYVAPEDMPDVCQDLDFNRDEQFREICGVKTRDYMAYRNIPEHRNLLLPKGGKIVKKGKSLELRLPNTLPAPLPSDFAGRIIFDEKLRRTFIKSKMDYCEFVPENSSQNVKLLKLDIPFDTGGDLPVCFTVESRPSTAQRKAGYAGRLDPLDCADFARLKSANEGRLRNERMEETPELPKGSETPKSSGSAE